MWSVLVSVGGRRERNQRRREDAKFELATSPPSLQVNQSQLAHLPHGRRGDQSQCREKESNANMQIKNEGESEKEENEEENAEKKVRWCECERERRRQRGCTVSSEGVTGSSSRVNEQVRFGGEHFADSHPADLFVVECKVLQGGREPCQYVEVDA